MKTVAVIAEYNPFHNGHAYQLQEIRRCLNADAVIVIMSGNFVQRGEPAMVEKAVRAKTALESGADLIIELPVLYATASAEVFAAGAVSILSALGCVDTLVFGAEESNLSAITQIAHILAEEPAEYRDLLKEYLQNGYTYPLASSTALQQYLKTSDIADILSKPNNILAIQYCKALYQLNSSIKPYLIPRKGAGYNEDTLSSDAEYSSATAIRKAMFQLYDGFSDTTGIPSADDLRIPSFAYENLLKETEQNRLLFPDSISPILHAKLIVEKETGFEQYLDISKELSDKIIKNLNSYTGFSQFCDLLKSKEYTYLRIRRSLLHIYLGITNELFRNAKEQGYAFYARPLGFNDIGKAVFSDIVKTSKIPLISKLADANTVLSRYENNDTAISLLKLDILASTYYESLLTAQTGQPIQNEFTKPMIILK